MMTRTSNLTQEALRIADSGVEYADTLRSLVHALEDEYTAGYDDGYDSGYSDALRDETELEKRAGRPAPTEAERRIAARIVVEGNKATRTKTPKWILELATKA